MSEKKLKDDPSGSSETHKLHPDILSGARLLTKFWYYYLGFSVLMVALGNWQVGMLPWSLLFGAAPSCLGYVLLEWDKS